MLDAHLEPAERTDEQSHEGDAGSDPQADDRGGRRRELMSIALHDRIDEHTEVELDLGLTHSDAAVEDGRRDQEPGVQARDPRFQGGATPHGEVRSLLLALGGVERGHDGALPPEQADGHDTIALTDLSDQALEGEFAVEVTPLDVQERFLGRSGKAGRQRSPALFHLVLEGPALVLGGDRRQADARRDQERNHQSAELDS